jgi:hypothetical protein
LLINTDNMDTSLFIRPYITWIILEILLCLYLIMFRYKLIRIRIIMGLPAITLLTSSVHIRLKKKKIYRYNLIELPTYEW